MSRPIRCSGYVCYSAVSNGWCCNIAVVQVCKPRRRNWFVRLLVRKNACSSACPLGRIGVTLRTRETTFSPFTIVVCSVVPFPLCLCSRRYCYWNLSTFVWCLDWITKLGRFYFSVNISIVSMNFLLFLWFIVRTRPNAIKYALPNFFKPKLCFNWSKYWLD